MRCDLSKATDVLRTRDAELCRLNDLTKVFKARECDHADRTKQLCDADKEVVSLSNVLNKICCENDHLDDQLGFQLAENDKLRKANAHEAARNDELTGRLLSLEAQLREKDNHLAVLHKEADGLRKAVDHSQFIKDDLSEQLLAINKHISTLTDQNNRLSFELTDITEKDAQIRAALDRRGRIKDLNIHNDLEMKKSLGFVHDVRSRSP